MFVAAVLSLSACGGGGGSSDISTTPLINGRVIDGYIRGAVVFWDCNKNGLQDADESSALSGAQGAYQIVDYGSKGCPLLAYVGPTAVDEDKPLQRGSAYTLQAVDGHPDLITGFTTLVAGKVASSGLTVAQANTEVAALFGLTHDLLVDYKASGSAPLNAAAQASVAALQATQAVGHGLLTDSARQTLDLVAQRYADSGFRAAIASGVMPFVESFKSLADQAAMLVTGNDANRLVRRVTYPTAAQNNALNAIVAAVNAQAAPRYGYPAWGTFSTDQLKSFALTINQLNAVQSDSPNSAKLQGIQQRRNALFAEASVRMNKEVGYDGAVVGVWNFFSSDPGASLDYGMAALAISGDIAGDVLTLATPRPKVGRPTNLTQYKKKLAAQLEIYKSVVSAGDCLVKVNKLEATDDLAGALVDVVTSCGGFMTDQLKEVGSTLHSGKLTDGLSAALNASGGIYGVVKEEDRVLVALKMSATTFGLTHDLLALFANDPVTSKTLSAADLALQFLNARVAAMELERAANQKLDDKLRAALAKFDEETGKAWRSYFISFMELYGDYYFEVKDSSQCQAGQVMQNGVCVDSSVTVLLEAFKSGVYSTDYDSNCYQKMTLGSIVNGSDYPIKETRWCISNGAWVQKYDSDPALTMLPSNGAWVPSNENSLTFADNMTFVSKYGGIQFESGIFKLLGLGGDYPAGSQWFGVEMTHTIDKFETYNNTTQNDVYNNSPSISAMMQRWSATNNGQDYLYRQQNAKFGWAFNFGAYDASGLVDYYDLTKAPVCSNSGCTRDSAYRAGWVRRVDTFANDVIELRTPTGLQDTDMSGWTDEKVIYVRRPASTGDTGVREGVRIVAGSKHSFAVYNRILFDAMLQGKGLPKTTN